MLPPVDIEQAIAALVSGALTGGAVWLADRRKQRLKGAVPSAATAQIKQSMILTELARDLGAHRALLLKVHNGGEIPHGGRDLMITALAESEPVDGVPRLAREIQRRPILDPEYLHLIHDLEEHRVLLIRTADLNRRSWLRDEHARAGIRSAWACVVRATPRSWFFVLAESRHEMDLADASRAIVRASASRLARYCVRDLDATLEDTHPISVAD